MPLRSSVERAYAAIDRTAAGVVAIARGLAVISFVSAVAFAVAVLLELASRTFRSVLLVLVLAATLTVPGWVLLAFRAAIADARQVPGAVASWHRKARDHYERVTTADDQLATGMAAARAIWEGGRDVGLIRSGLAATRLSFVIAAVICALLVPLEVLLALTVLAVTAIL